MRSYQLTIGHILSVLSVFSQLTTLNLFNCSYICEEVFPLHSIQSNLKILDSLGENTLSQYQSQYYHENYTFTKHKRLNPSYIIHAVQQVRFKKLETIPHYLTCILSKVMYLASKFKVHIQHYSTYIKTLDFTPFSRISIKYHNYPYIHHNKHVNKTL